MASHKLIVKPSVEKDLRSLPRPMITRALAQMEKLVEAKVIAIHYVRHRRDVYRGL